MMENKKRLSSSIRILFAAQYCTVDTECLSSSDCDFTILGENCMFNWKLFNRQIPPAESPESEVKDCVRDGGADAEKMRGRSEKAEEEIAGMHLQAAKYLHELAAAADNVMKKRGIEMMDAWERVNAFSDRAHGEALRALLCGHILRLQEEDGCESKQGASIAYESECFSGILMACSIIERSFVDLCWHQSKSLHGKDGPAPPPLLKDLILSPLVADCVFPPGATSWMSMLFHPCCMNIRNIAWHGFLERGQVPCTILSLMLLLAVSLPKAPKRAWILPGPFAEHYANQTPLVVLEENQVLRLPDLLHLDVVSMKSIENFFHTSPFIPGGHRPLLLHALGALKEGRITVWCNIAICVLEHSLRVLFAQLNDCPNVTLVRGSEYFSTVDGYGQSAKRQLLLAQTIHPCLRAGTQNPGFEPESGASDDVLVARDGVPDPTDVVHSGFKPSEEEGDEDGPGEENRLCNWLGQGPMACLKDLFLMEHGPRLRAKLAHGDIEICAAHCLSAGDRDKMHLVMTRAPNSQIEMDGLETRACGMENAKELGALLLALLVMLCHRRSSDANEGRRSQPTQGASGVQIGDLPPEMGAAKGVAEAASDEGIVIEQCCRYMETYVSKFHPLILLRHEVEQLKSSVRSWTEVSSRFSLGQPQPCQNPPAPGQMSAQTTAAQTRNSTPSREMFQVVVKVTAGGDDMVITDTRERLAAAQPPSDETLDQLLREVLRASSELPGPATGLALAGLEASTSSITALTELYHSGVHSVAGIECLRACAEAGSHIARAAAQKLLSSEAAIRCRTARTPERRQLLHLLRQASSLTSVLLSLLALIDLQILHARAASALHSEAFAGGVAGAPRLGESPGLAPAFKKLLIGMHNAEALVEKVQYDTAVCKAKAALTAPDVVGAVKRMCQGV